jgi:hypothetical protein
VDARRWVSTEGKRGGVTVNTVYTDVVVAGQHHVEPRTAGRSLGWLAVAVALAIIAIFVMGTMAEARWCGAELCVEASDF